METPSAERLVQAKLEQWRQRLLDLTKRNRLLFFQDKRTAAFQLTSPDFPALLEKALSGKHLRFPMLKAGTPQEAAGPEAGGQGALPERAEDIRPGDVGVAVPVKDLQSRLYRLRRDWHTWQEEQGVQTLFLAIGFLQWRESAAQNEPILSPLILVPVGLKREQLDKPFALELLDEDPIANPALSFRFETDYQTSLPRLPDELDPAAAAAYLEQVQALVKDKGWTVLRQVWLGRFTYEKFVMSQDLADHEEAARRHPVVAALSKAGSLPRAADPAELSDLDDKLDPAEVFPALDADSSQLEALVRARHGQNILIQGPPGTGKSQTIVNLIVQSLRDGKRVLFVSEKMAALEVVHRRIKEAGLAFSCLEVHSHRSNKARIVQELGRTLDNRFAQPPPDDAAERFEKLKRQRARLNAYARELHAPRGARRLSAFGVHGKLARLSALPDLASDMPFGDPLGVGARELDDCLDALGALARIPEVADNPSAHPWHGAAFDPKMLSDRDKTRLLGAVSALGETAAEIPGTAAPIAEALGLGAPPTLEQAGKLTELCGSLKAAPKLTAAWITASKARLGELARLLGEAEQRGARLAQALSGLGGRFHPALLEEPVEDISGRFAEKYSSMVRLLLPSYWRDWRALRRHWRGPGWLTFDKASTGVSLAATVRSERRWLGEHRDELSRSFAGFFAGEGTDWGAARKGLEWLQNVFELSACSDLPAKLQALLERDARKACPEAGALEALIRAGTPAAAALSAAFPGKGVDREPFPDLVPWLAAKRRPADLEDWSEYLLAKGACGRAKLAAFVEEFEAKQLPSKDLRDAFMKAFWKAWLAKAHETSPVLGEFRQRTHDELLAEFRDLDRQLKAVTANLVQQAIERRQPKGATGISDDGQVGTLRKEMQKKKRLKPLRRLFAEIPHLLQELKPCLLMSPLSVASFLGSSPYSFDLVIFDEASQIPPADAIGAILRAQAAVVVGDDKQLPPTRFFQADVDPDEELDEGPVEEPLESILDECAALPGFVRTQLRWHYRSRYEELIAFSNAHFYEGRLITFPSPTVSGSSGAVKFLHVPDGVYDRGRSRTNRREAELVAELLEKHCLEHGNAASVGVITLNLAQEEAIWKEWERRKSLRPELAAFDDRSAPEPLFIKALEKVQGDERDFIILSVGYGPDSTGAVALNFGPINQSGGERRLNVAVTRARRQTTVVASLLPSQLDLARLNRGHLGVAALQQYLEYARNGGAFAASAAGTGPTESDFEDAVKAALTTSGLKVDAQVGCSGFRIDLGIRHPTIDTEYILGLECDGATYHSFPTARDRDRLRQEVLESLGWHIHRIWSTDWSRNRERIVAEVVRRVGELAARQEPGVPRRPVPRPEAARETADRAGAAPAPQPVAPLGAPALHGELPVYREFAPPERYPRDLFYAAEDGGAPMRALAALVKAIVEIEGPVHVTCLTQRVAAAYGLGRVGENIEKIVRLAIQASAAGGAVVPKRDFPWHGRYDPDAVTPRRPQAGEAQRPAQFVAVEELAAAALWILGKDRGAPRDSLVTSVARLMGYDRTGHRVEERVEEALSFLLDAGRVARYGDQLILLP